MKVFAPMNKGLGHLGLLVPSRFFYYFKFCMLLMKVSPQGPCIVVFQNENFLYANLMMTRFLGDEMTLKTTLLMWEPMVTSNGLVSWVTNLDERL